MDILVKLSFFIFMLGGLIFCHEAGHFLAARGLGIQVREFGLGLPPRLLRLGEWRGTAFTLNWVPLGGFVRPAGDFDPTFVGGLAASPAWKRIVVFAAGPLSNLLVGYLILVVAFRLGWPDQLRVAGVRPGSPAAAAGVRAGDLLLRANGATIHDARDWTAFAEDNLNQPVRLEIQRGAGVVTLSLTPRSDWSSDRRLTGLDLRPVTLKYPLPAASRRAAERVALQIHETVMLPIRALRGELKPGEARLSGLVGLKQISDKILENAFRSRTLQPVLNLTALISVALGFTNLLPIAALDGGRLAFALLELLRRRPVNAQREKLVHLVGMAAILSLMAVLIVQDVLYPVF